MAEYLTLSDLEKQQRGEYLTLTDLRKMQSAPEIKVDPTEGMSGLDLFRAGLGKGMVDLARGAGQFVGLVNRDDVAQARKRDEALMSTGYGKTGNFVGNVAAAAPLALIPGANTFAGSAAIGALSGALQPSTSTEETVSNIGLGGLAGSVVPAAITAGKVGAAFIDPFFEAGRNRIIGRTMRTVAGNQADDAMRAMQQAVPNVPGSMPTAAEVARNPGIAALQRTAVQTDPVAMGEMALRQQANQDARIAAITGMAPEKAASVAAREAATAPLYDAAKQATVAMSGQLPDLMKRPSMVAAMSRAQQLAAEAGENLDVVKAIPAQASMILNASGAPAATTSAQAGAMSGKAAHYLKMALDDMANASPATGIAGNELRAIKGTRAEFLSELEKQVPAYAQARSTYAAMSQPITARGIADEIIQRSTNNIRDGMTPASFNRAMSDKTAQAVTGQARSTLENSLTPQQFDVLKSVRKDLQGLDFANNAGRLGGGSDTVQKMAYSNLMAQSGVPSWLTNNAVGGIAGSLLQRVGNVAYADANRKMAEKLALSLLDPKEAAKLMRKGVTSQGLLSLQDAAMRSALPLSGGLLGTLEWAQ